MVKLKAADTNWWILKDWDYSMAVEVLAIGDIFL